jgi:hypothetical protein
MPVTRQCSSSSGLITPNTMSMCTQYGATATASVAIQTSSHVRPSIWNLSCFKVATIVAVFHEHTCNIVLPYHCHCCRRHSCFIPSPPCAAAVPPYHHTSTIQSTTHISTLCSSHLISNSSFQPHPLNINHDALSSPLSQLSELGTTPSKPSPSNFNFNRIFSVHQRQERLLLFLCSIKLLALLRTSKHPNSEPLPLHSQSAQTSTPSFQHHKHRFSLVDTRTIPPILFYFVSSPSSYLNLPSFSPAARIVANRNS